MTTPLVFIDTETDGLGPQRRAWEIAMIRRDHLGTTETAFFLPLDLGNSDPTALQIGRFWDRHPTGRKMAGHREQPDSVNVLSTHDAAKEVMRWTFGAHLVGAVPSFDAEIFARLLRANGYLPQWHYHLIDVEALALGWLNGRGQAVAPPYSGQALGLAVGVAPQSEDERHTALGDARWAKRVYDATVGGESA